MYAECFAFSGFRVAEAASGAEAVEKAIELTPDVILMDLSLPGMDGWEATRRLKANRRTKHIPVVALTGHAFAGFSDSAKQAGCDAFITKPCLPDELVGSASIARERVGASAEGRSSFRQPEERTNLGPDNLGLTGFQQVGGAACFECLEACIRIAGDGNHGDSPGRTRVAQSAYRFTACEARHLEVHDNHIGRQGDRVFEPAEPVVGKHPEPRLQTDCLEQAGAGVAIRPGPPACPCPAPPRGSA